MTPENARAREALLALQESRVTFGAAAGLLAGLAESDGDIDVLDRECDRIREGFMDLLDVLARIVGRRVLVELVSPEMERDGLKDGPADIREKHPPT